MQHHKTKNNNINKIHMQRPQNPYTTQPQQPQYQQQMYQPNYDARVSPPKPPTMIQLNHKSYHPPILNQHNNKFNKLSVHSFTFKKPVLDFVKPWVDYGLNEAKHTSHEHALTEVAAIMFLVGKGFNPTTHIISLNLGRRMNSFRIVYLIKYKTKVPNPLYHKGFGTFNI